MKNLTESLTKKRAQKQDQESDRKDLEQSVSPRIILIKECAQINFENVDL